METSKPDRTIVAVAVMAILAVVCLLLAAVTQVEAGGSHGNDGGHSEAANDGGEANDGEANDGEANDGGNNSNDDGNDGNNGGRSADTPNGGPNCYRDGSCRNTKTPDHDAGLRLWRLIKGAF